MSALCSTRTSLIAAAALVAVTLAAPRAHAQGEVKAMGKGLVGLGLLSGELVLSIEALAGVKHPAALAVPTIVAAGGGAVGGYFIDKKVNNPSVSVALLACGMALFLPAIVIAVAKTKYVSEKDLAEDVSVTVAGEEEGEAEEEAEETTETEAEAETEAAAPSGAVHALVDVSSSRVLVGVPPLEVYGLFSDEELRFLARAQGVEYRLSLLHVAF